jgi:hypothetical protein
MSGGSDGIMPDDFLDVRRRLAAVGSASWAVVRELGGTSLVRVNDDTTMTVTVDRQPAQYTNAAFIACAPGVVRSLLRALDGARVISARELAVVEELLNGVTSRPWRPFLESAGSGGESFISTSPADGTEGEMYVRVGDALAPDYLYDFIGEAPQDIALLIAEVRLRQR